MVAALKFLYVDTLGCAERVTGLRARKKPRKLPRYMTEEEVERLILATPDLRYRAAIVSGTGFDDLTITADGTSAVIDLSDYGGGEIRLENVAVADMDAEDFIFYEAPADPGTDGM